MVGKTKQNKTRAARAPSQASKHARTHRARFQPLVFVAAQSLVVGLSPQCRPGAPRAMRALVALRRVSRENKDILSMGAFVCGFGGIYLHARSRVPRIAKQIILSLSTCGNIIIVARPTCTAIGHEFGWRNRRANFLVSSKKINASIGNGQPKFRPPLCAQINFGPKKEDQRARLRNASDRRS